MTTEIETETPETETTEADPTEAMRLPKCRQNHEQEELFDAPWPQPLDVVMLSGMFRPLPNLKPAVVVARHDGEVQIDLVVIPLDEEDRPAQALRITDVDLHDQESGEPWTAMNTGEQFRVQKIWEEWVDGGMRVSRRTEDQAAWREELATSKAEFDEADKLWESRKRQLKSAKEEREFVQARVMRLAGDGDGCVEWPWSEGE